MLISHKEPFNPHIKHLMIDVKLVDQDEDSTRTEFFFDGVKKGYGVEDEYRETKVKGETRIPNGVYEIGFRWSPKFSGKYYRNDVGNILYYKDRKTQAQKEEFHTEHEMIWVLDVPLFEYILWHWGNTDEDTDGCYCVGSKLARIKARSGKMKNGVSASRKKYEEIYPIMWAAKFLEGYKIYANYDR